MILHLHELPTTQQSQPFISAVERCCMAAHGYAEREYLFSGTANVYGTGAKGETRIVYPDAPYTNRMIVRCPADPARFGGHVVVEILNATARFDIERMWILSHRYFMQHGVAYIGMTSKPDVFGALRAYDAERYAAINWPNPTPQAEWIEPPVAQGPARFIHADQECGLIWDMLTDVARALHTDSDRNPLKGYGVKHITLTGWSQSSCYLTRYVNSFESVYDGYLAAGGVHTLAIPLNQSEYCRPWGSADTRVRRMALPFVIVQTESEAGLMGGIDVPRIHSDEPDHLCRLYEIAGATHDNRQALLDYYAGDERLERTGFMPKYGGAHARCNDYPFDIPVSAAFHHLLRWIEDGIAPAMPDLLQLDAEGHALTDAFGNAMGGVRTAMVDLPVAKYVPWSHWPVGDQTFLNGLWGHVEPYAPEALTALYGTLEAYERRVRAVTVRHVAQGYVLAEDAERLICCAVESAKVAGLV